MKNFLIAGTSMVITFFLSLAIGLGIAVSLADSFSWEDHKEEITKLTDGFVECGLSSAMAECKDRYMTNANQTSPNLEELFSGLHGLGGRSVPQREPLSSSRWRPGPDGDQFVLTLELESNYGHIPARETFVLVRGEDGTFRVESFQVVYQAMLGLKTQSQAL